MCLQVMKILHPEKLIEGRMNPTTETMNQEEEDIPTIVMMKMIAEIKIEIVIVEVVTNHMTENTIDQGIIQVISIVMILMTRIEEVILEATIITDQGAHQDGIIIAEIAAIILIAIHLIIQTTSKKTQRNL